MIVLFFIFGAGVTIATLWYHFTRKGTFKTWIIKLVGFVQGLAFSQAFVCNVFLFPFSSYFCILKNFALSFALLMYYAYIYLKEK